MKLFSKFFLLIVMLFLLVSPGCKKKNNNNNQVTMYISDNMKKYTIFQQGSFWIYKNEQKGILDSATLSHPPMIYYYTPYGRGHNSDTTWEICSIDLNGYFMFSSGVDYGASYFGNKFGDVLPCIKSDSFESGRTFQINKDNFLKNIEFFDSSVLNGNTYYSVIHTKLQHIADNGDTLNFTFYIAKSVGLIKYVQNVGNTDTTWSLVRYHVIQ